jgi:TonB family protein
VSDTDKVYRQSEVDRKAVIDQKSWLASSPSRMGCEVRSGTTTLRVVLHKMGRVTDVELRGKSGCESFDKRAINAAGKVKFKPAMKDGNPVSQYAVFQYKFDVW